GRAPCKEKDSVSNYAQYKKCSRNFTPTHASAMLSDGLQFARQFRVTDLIRVEVRDAQTSSVFHLECADVVQERPPAFGFGQVLSYIVREKDVPRVATTHHPGGRC